jgi:probable addiction module antidote protein
MKLKNISETFENDLQDPEFVRVYLEEALNDGVPNFLLALRYVVQANQGMAAIAQETDLGRESLYKTLSEAGNPNFATIEKILKSIGMRLVQSKVSKHDRSVRRKKKNRTIAFSLAMVAIAFAKVL